MMFSGFRSRCTTPWRMNVFKRLADADGNARGAFRRKLLLFLENGAQQLAVHPLHHHVDLRTVGNGKTFMTAG
jgi:hypothetical protein